MSAEAAVGGATVKVVTELAELIVVVTKAPWLVPDRKRKIRPTININDKTILVNNLLFMLYRQLTVTWIQLDC